MEQQAVTLPAGEATAAALAVRELAEVRGGMELARQYPRDEIRARESLELSATRGRFAEMAEYSFTRGGKPIVGGSVYLAREMLRCWGHITAGFQELPTGDDSICHLEGFARDLQTGATYRLQDRFPLRVQRKVWNEATRMKETQWVTPDDRDARELKNKRGAILVRNCLFALMPPDLVEDVIAACRSTNEKAARGDLDEDRPKVIRATCTTFGKLGVSVELLEKHLGHSVAGLTAEELAELRGIWKSIKEGHTQIADHFQVTPTTGGKDEELDAALAAKNKSEEPKKPRKKRGITKVQKEALENMLKDGLIDPSKLSPYLPEEGDTVLEAIDALTQEQATPLVARALGSEFAPDEQASQEKPDSTTQEPPAD